MMKSFFKKLAFVMALAMVVSLAAPAAQAAYAATEFTYAYQNAGTVDTLYMEAGDEVDLCFKGVRDYKNYTLEWKSANPLVATVDKNGVVKAVENGTTTVELVVGDGTVYTSTPVKVVVGEEIKVALGTSADDTFTTKTLEIGTTVDLGFFGVPNYSEKNYSYTWISNAPEVAKVDQIGNVVAVAAGSATVTVAIVNNVTGDTLTVAPVVFTVPTPEVELAYEVKQISDTQATITFNKDVTFTAKDVSLVRVYDNDIEVVWPLEEVKVDGRTFTITPYVDFADGEEYIVRVGTEDEGTEFTTTIGAVDRLEVTYKSMDKTGKAYTNGEDGEEIIVYLDTKLYSGSVDVTNVYGKDEVVYTLLTENENINIDEYAGEMSFYLPNIAATVVATYTYYDGDNEKTVQTPVEMTSEMAPEYTVKGVSNWTIVKNGQEKIDWSKPVREIAAYDDLDATYYIVALITDSYGNTFVTDSTYANNDAKIYAIEGSRFETEGYYIQFASANVEKMLVGEDGSLTTYTATSVPAIISLHNTNSEREGNLVRNLHAASVKVKAQRTISKVELSSASMTLITDANETSFTEDSVDVKVYDQYGDVWSKEVTLAVSSNVDTVQCDGKDIPANVTVAAGDKGTLKLSGAAIALDTDKTSVTFTVKENNSGKSDSIKVTLKAPRYEKDDAGNATSTIDITNWSLDAGDVDQAIAKEEDGTTKAATVKYYQLSNSYKVGLETDVTLVTNADDLKLTDATTSKGDRYIVVYAPDNTVVKAASGSSLGVVDKGDGSYEVTVAVANGDTMSYAAEGTYTVKVLEVSSFNKKTNEAVLRTKFSDTFKVTNTSKGVSFKKQTELSSNATDINQIVKDTMAFTLGGSDWDYKVSDIVEVKGRYNAEAGYVVITSVTFNVPLNGDNDYVGYTKTVTVNKSVEVDGVVGLK